MARRRHSKPTPHYLVNLGLGVAVLTIVAATGVQLANLTRAATVNPYGYADFCALENNTTIIYGWASDPNANSLTQPLVNINAGGQAVTVTTDRGGYRDAAINAWIDKNRPGDPKPGTYGFRAPLAGLYKGTRNVITGSVINEGPGSSVILNINTNGPTDGVSGRPYFAGNVIPEVCLADRTTAAPSPPAPTPTAPRPGGGTPTPAPGAASSSASTGTPAGTLSAVADATITSGTLAASLKVPAGGAAHVRILYGTNQQAPDQVTEDFPVEGDAAIVPIHGLDPKATYAYQIVRFDAVGRTTTSPIGTFKTRGFTIAVRFKDDRDKNIKDIPATISDLGDTERKTNDKGIVEFPDVSAGSHTVSFVYANRKYDELVTATAATIKSELAKQIKPVTVEHTVNVDQLPRTGQPLAAAEDESSALPAVIILGMIALLIALAFVLFRRYSKRQYAQADIPPPPPLPEYQPVKPAAVIEEPIDINQLPVIERPEGAEHMGESLKAMVLRSMAEEAKRRQGFDVRHPPAGHHDRHPPQQ
ncbi:MAG TPA: hypothetical protein VK978_00580 [Candidatus Saccharimonadales bacterium]|nr:hypothetical protein [Candidatus Saccharimonadales bacterium]